MDVIVKQILKSRKIVITLFIIITIICAVLSTMVSINYDMVDYLPDEAPSTVAMNTMKKIYEKAVPNLRVMIPNVSIPQALKYKEFIKMVDGVEDINWLDDKIDIKIPLETHDKETVEDWYKNGNAVFLIVVRDNGQRETLTEIRNIIGVDGAMSGNPVDTVNAQSSTSDEITRMMMIIIPLMFFILILTSTSWFVPILYMINVGVAIVINMGTNLMFGEISFITKTTGAILQLACSMDYSIFLLDRFEEIKATGKQPLDAMAEAIIKSISSILSSGLTTVVGFAALIIMRFKIGPDMGYVLAKGIVISLFVTLVFLPSIILCSYKIIDKTLHRTFIPSFEHIAIASNKANTFVTILVLLLLIPCYIAQQNVSFMYGMSGMASPDSQVAKDRAAIDSVFGQSASFALIVPKGSLASEQKINEDLKALQEVSSVISYVENVGKSIPEQYVPEESLKMLNSDKYTRFVIMAQIPPENDETFAFVSKIRKIAQNYYPDYYLAGESANVNDMKDTITADNIKVNLIAIGAIAIILMFTFKSVSLPLILLITIESSIFINLAIPYFRGQTLNYIGYLIISSVQLGATVDYAILFTNRFIENRSMLNKNEAITKTISDTASSILTSGGILASAGFVLGFISTNGVISQLGILIARGAILSAILVLVFLPALLKHFEYIVKKTTKKFVTYSSKVAEGKEVNL